MALSRTKYPDTKIAMGLALCHSVLIHWLQHQYSTWVGTASASPGCSAKAPGKATDSAHVWVPEASQEIQNSSFLVLVSLLLRLSGDFHQS